MINQKEINNYWEKEVCGTRRDNITTDEINNHHYIMNTRYKYEGFIKDFLLDESLKDKKFLEIGVGAGTDFRRRIPGGRFDLICNSTL